MGLVSRVMGKATQKLEYFIKLKYLQTISRKNHSLIMNKSKLQIFIVLILVLTLLLGDTFRFNLLER